MSILTEKQILKPYIKKATGYIKSLLSAQHVEMNNGITLQSAVDEIHNNLIDSVIERGGTRYNGYTKWKSGKLEQWCNAGIAAKTTSEWGGCYISNKMAGLTYSIPFLEPPLVMMNVKGEANDGGWLLQTNAGTSFSTPSYYIIRGAILSSNATFNISAYAIGVWK